MSLSYEGSSLVYKGRSVRNEVNKGKKLIQLYVSQEKWDQLREAADSVEEPITTFCRRAIYGTLRSWKPPTLPSNNWPKCSYCGRKHDEKEHEV